MDGEGGRRWFVDRREGESWIVVDGADHVLELPSWLFPAGTRGGDILDVVADDLETGARRILIRRNEGATDSARREASAQLERLRETDPGGNLSL